MTRSVTTSSVLALLLGCSPVVAEASDLAAGKFTPTVCNTAPPGDEPAQSDDRGAKNPPDADGSVRLWEGMVARLAGHDVGVFYVIEHKIKIAIFVEGDEDEGWDVVIEVGGSVTIGQQSFTLVRTDVKAKPPYAVLAPCRPRTSP